VQKTLMAHDLLTRALLARLAVAEPDTFRQVAQSLTGLKMLRDGGAGGEMPREVADELAQILGEVARSAQRSRGG